MRAVLVLLLTGIAPSMVPTMTMADARPTEEARQEAPAAAPQEARQEPPAASPREPRREPPAGSSRKPPRREPPGTSPQEPGRTAVLEAARDIMEAARYAALVTLDAGGRPQARAMDPFAPEGDLTVWMGTNRTTRKVEQLRRDPRATLYYFDPEGLGYVTLLGKAEIVDDLDERRARWRPEWADYYPGGPGGETYLLLRFVPHRLEIVSPEHGIADEPLAWKPRIVELGPEPDGGP